MNCRDCKYCVYIGSYTCVHPELEKSAKKYEDKNNKRIGKSHSHIGYKLIKTSLRYCPYKMIGDDK